MTYLRLSVLALLLATAGSGFTVQAVETRTYEYDMPSSFVVRGVFGFGALVCHYAELESAQDAARNGPCIDYTGFEDSDFLLSAHDLVSSPSITLAVDVDGDGCVSAGCGDRDFRANGCGALGGRLPIVDPGVQPVIEVFIRVVDVDTATGGSCIGSRGAIVIDYGGF